MENILLYSSLLSTITCFNGSSISIDITNSFCSKQVNGAVVFLGTLTTSGVLTTQETFNYLSDWYQSRPVLFFDGVPTVVDLDCGFLIQSESSMECPSDTSSLTPGGPYALLAFLILFVSSVAGLGLVVVSVLLVILSIRKYLKRKQSRLQPNIAVR